jgi:chemotaxis family two-component system sensor kinase Cph1
MTFEIDSLADDERKRLEDCAREPIRLPGSIQPHGALLSIAPATLTIVHASDNCGEILGIDARSLLGRPLHEAVGPVWTAAHHGALSGATIARNPIPLTIDSRQFEAIVHQDGPIFIVEFEPVIDNADAALSVAVYGAMHRLARLREQQSLWRATARELSDLTGFERVLIYSFHPDGHGEIVAEEVPDDMEPYLGLHFPASDIPTQARDLYLTKLSRLIANNSGATSSLLTLPSESHDATPLDLGQAELRSVSPHHLQFMRNMGQASTLSLSLVRDGRLIGMITLASRTPHRVSYVLRQGLEVLANQVALQLASMDEIDRLLAQVQSRSIRAQLVGQTAVLQSANTADLAAALFEGDLTVLNLIPASGAVLSLGGATFGVGTVPPDEKMAVLREWARANEIDRSYATDSLTSEHPDLAAQLEGIAGLLFARLPGSGDFMAWFRPELLEDVKWLGAQTPENRSAPLSPRTSFSSWTQSVSGKSAAWDGLEAEAEELSRDLAGAIVRHAEISLAALALRDPLTGLPNRRRLMDRLVDVLDEEHPTSSTALIFVDVDHFKTVNDTYGHDVGDKVLLFAAQRILTCTRSIDTVARLGGDEFVVLCEDATTEDAATVAERIVEAMREPMDVGGTSIVVTVSVGLADVKTATVAEDLLRAADVAMYRAKNSGRDRAAL